MPVEFKDYYATLGVSPQASVEAIKKAFRKLARQHHPDVAQDKKAAEEKFKELNEAYEVLSDPAKRRKYDQLGANWKAGRRTAPHPGPGGATPGAEAWTSPDGSQSYEFHFDGTGFSDFFERFFGGGRQSGFEDLLRQGGASTRSGRGFPGAESAQRGHDVEGDILVTLPEALQGSVRQVSLQRPNPRTHQPEIESFKVRIPAGVQSGQTIRVPAKGGPGSGQGSPGDLYLHVRFAAHPDLRPRGADLYHELDLAPWEAVLGTNVEVPTLDGRVTLRIPAGTGNGQKLRVKGRGLPRGTAGDRGDLYVVVGIQLPLQLTDRERSLWEQLRSSSSFNPRLNT